MKRKFLAAILVAFLCLGTYLTNAQAASVRMKIVVLNPSATLAQTKSVRAVLPKEITIDDIKDDGGLTIEYDNKEGAYVAVKNDIYLEPGETKVFEIILVDAWMINEERLESMRKRTESIVRGMKTTKAYDKALMIGEGIYARIDTIIRTQNDPNATSPQHMAHYRNNTKLMVQIEKDLDELEKLLVTAGGTVSLDAVENADLNVKGPDAKTTWIIIFVILIFIGILGGVFYFTWAGQIGSKPKAPSDDSNPFKENNPQAPK